MVPFHKPCKRMIEVCGSRRSLTVVDRIVLSLERLDENKVLKQQAELTIHVTLTSYRKLTNSVLRLSDTPETVLTSARRPERTRTSEQQPPTQNRY